MAAARLPDVARALDEPLRRPEATLRILHVISGLTRGGAERQLIILSRELLRRGCLWNTFVMVGRATSFVDLLRSRAPDQFRAFEQLRQPIVALDAEAVHRVYDSLLQADFSQKVLSTCTERLLVLRLNVGWCDLGKPERVLATLAQAGIEPGWATALSGEERAYSATA